MSGLVLSLFPGIDLLGMAFEAEGFCVVRGPDVIFGGDIRGFHPPAGRFDGVIGGPPCQAFSTMRHLVRARGYEPRFGNLIPEYERCVAEAKPLWFVMENVAQAPVPSVEGYGVHAFMLDNRQLGEKQARKRRWSFGWRGGRRVLAVETVVFEHPEYEYAAIGGDESISVFNRRKPFKSGVMRRPGPTRQGIERLRRLQGLPEGWSLRTGKKCIWTVEGEARALSNGVPLPMGRAIARAVKQATTRG